MKSRERLAQALGKVAEGGIPGDDLEMGRRELIFLV